MERGIGDLNILRKFILEFSKIVEKHCKYIVVSGFVAIAHGRSRATEDIDMIIDKIGFDEFKELHEDLIKNGFECLQSIKADVLFNEYLLNGISIRYVWKDKHLPELELKFAKDSLDEIQLETRIKLPLTGLDIYFSTIEMNIAFKEELLKSRKDMEDAKHLRIIYEKEINEENINNIKKSIKKIKLKEDRANIPYGER
jgi:hypothetical protein